MKLDHTSLRLIRAAAQAVADECSTILAEQAGDTPAPATVEAPPPAPSKRGRKSAAPAPTPAPAPEPSAPEEPAIVSTPPAPTNVAASSIHTAEDLALVAEQVTADPEKTRRYVEWRDSTEFKGMKLSQIPNVGDNYDRVYEALCRANV